MFGDDLGVAHVPTPVETGDLNLLECGEYRVVDVILSKMSLRCTHWYGAQPAHVRPLVAP